MTENKWKKNKILLKTNLLVCIIILTGFCITSVISYRSNLGIFEKEVERVSTLSAAGLYNNISTIFAQPVNVSLTMANDNLLKDFLLDEESNRSDEVWRTRMSDYLNGYQRKYGYDSVFLVSSATHNYYHFEGIDRVLTKGDPENTWYYNFLVSNDEYSLNVDNDEATDNSITVFVNCKIKGADDSTLGIVGVGLRVNSLQALLSSYEEQYGVKTYLIDKNGKIEVSSSATRYEQKNLFDLDGYASKKEVILQNKHEQESFWYPDSSGDSYVVTRYEPNLQWYLVVDNDTSEENRYLSIQLAKSIFIIVLIILLVLIIITSVIKRYNVQISELTISQELEYQRLLHEATEGLYENIYEFDITHNCASGEATRKYFESMGFATDMLYDEALHIIASKQIKTEFIKGYIDTFSQKAVMEAYKNGISNLNCDLMIAEDSENYRWIRISAQIFYWHSDNSVRMITFHKNIDAEKKQEFILLDSIRRDSMTGLYNKLATEKMISDALKSDQLTDDQHHVFLIFDIDNFKNVNDTMGHNFGDYVIQEMAAELKSQFREYDILGRIGGDEFVVLMKNIDNIVRLKQKLELLCLRIEKKNFSAKKTISCSIGVALFPSNGTTYTELYKKADQALYYAKSHGKNYYAIFDECVNDDVFHLKQRDLESLVTIATDGLAQYACTDPLKLIYFSQKYVELFGISATVLSAPDYDPLEPIHPDDVDEVRVAIKKATLKRTAFTRSFRIRHQDGDYISVQLRGLFIDELYKSGYPIFYVMYIKQ